MIIFIIFEAYYFIKILSCNNINFQVGDQYSNCILSLDNSSPLHRNLGSA